MLVDRFYAERLYSSGELRELLTRAGFCLADMHSDLITGSARSGRRKYFVSGPASRSWSWPPDIKVCLDWLFDYAIDSRQSHECEGEF